MGSLKLLGFIVVAGLLLIPALGAVGVAIVLAAAIMLRYFVSFKALAVMAIAGAVSWAMFGAEAVIISSLVVLIGYIIELRFHLRTACGTCGGQGRFYSHFFLHLFRLCKNCGGNGRIIHPHIAYFGTANQKAKLRADRAAAAAGVHYQERA